MTLDEAKEKYDQAMAKVDYYNSSIEELLDRYGSGVRPSWVSTDVSLDQMRRSEWQQQADYYSDLIEKMEEE